MGALLLPHTLPLCAAPSQPAAQFAAQIETALAEGRKYRSSGRFGEAVKAFERAAHDAAQAGDIDREALALASASGCQIRLFQYRAALESSTAARELASKAADSSLAGVASTNLSTIYSQLGAFELAKREAERSVNLLRSSARQDFLFNALLNYGEVEAETSGVEAGRHSYQQAIAVARKAGKPDLEAMAQDHVGTWLLLEGKLPEAETALNTAFDMRVKIHDENGLAVTKEHLAELELKKKNPAAALKLIDEAFSSSSPLFKTTPQYYPINIRGRIILALGHKPEALAEFRRAVDSAAQWRQGALPGDATSTQTVARLHDVYEDYIELAAETALEDGDRGLSREALEALIGNRAANLREQMTLALGRNFRLPGRYFELLSDLQAAQGQVTLGENGDESKAKLAGIRLELYDLENKIGLESKNSEGVGEKNLRKNSLKGIQKRISDNEVLLSFCLGNSKSFLWVLTGDQVNLYELPGENELGNEIKEFSGRVQQGENADLAGQVLSATLFGKLDSRILQKRDWIIATDGALVNELPFAALPAPSKVNAPLIGKHTLRFLPSELLLADSQREEPEGRFVGVADPIYNFADARRNRSQTFVKTKQATTPIALARLVASDLEIRSAAKASGMRDVQLLEGREASGAALQQAIDSKPEVLHFAVHVVSPDKNPQQAALALSLTKESMPELLTSEAIATYRVPGSLVVLSGCSSAKGEVLPSAGLMGLTRAWLLAGASAVIASAWATPDDSGRFFACFYRHLQAIKSGSLAKRAAAALQQAQLEMEQSKGYRSLPSFWAAYSIISKE